MDCFGLVKKRMWLFSLITIIIAIHFLTLNSHTLSVDDVLRIFPVTHFILRLSNMVVLSFVLRRKWQVGNYVSGVMP
jgi:hypothetical protein